MPALRGDPETELLVAAGRWDEVLDAPLPVTAAREVAPGPLTVAPAERARPVTRVPEPIMRRSPAGDPKE